MRVRTLTFAAALTGATYSFGQATLTKVNSTDAYRVVAAATAYSGSLVAIGAEDKSVRVVDIATMKTKFQGTGHPRPPQALAFNRAGTLLASGDETARLYLWDVKTGRKIREFSRDRGHTKGIIGIAFSPDGQKIATVGDDDVIKVWKTGGGNPIGTILGSGANLYGVSWTSSGSILTGTLADGLRLYSGSNYTLVSKMPVPGGQGVNSIAATADGSRAVTAGRDGQLSMFNVGSRQRAYSSPGHSDWIMKVAVSPNGKLAASASSDRTVGVWSVATGQKIQTLQNTSPVGSAVGFTGDGRYLITTSLSDGLVVYSVSPPQGGSASSKATSTKSKKKRKR